MAVMTVLGEIDADKLGITLPHEHIYIDLTTFYEESEQIGRKWAGKQRVALENLGVLYRDPFAIKDNLVIDDEHIQQDELMYFKKAGGKTIVDATSRGIGRDAVRLRDMSIVTGLNVIAGAGYYVNSSHPSSINEKSIHSIAEEIVRDLTAGMDGTDIKAGVIGEIGVSDIVYPNEKKVLVASAMAQKETGAGILVHINPWTTNGIQANKLLVEQGIAPGKICICHVDVENRKDYILELLDGGVLIEFDNFGKEYYVDPWNRKSGYGCFVKDTERVRLVKELIDLGYVNQLLLSCDVCLKILLHRYGGWGYDHLLTNIVPMMREVGITREQINTILVKNPAKFLDKK